MNFGKDLALKRLKYSLSAADYLFSYGKNKNIPLRVGKSQYYIRTEKSVHDPSLQRTQTLIIKKKEQYTLVTMTTATFFSK